MFIFLPINIIYYIIIIFFSFSCLITRSWIEVWIFLELINISFIPIILINQKFKISSVNVFKIYVIFTITSYIILLILTINKYKYFFLFILILFLVKLNLRPFYIWYILIIKDLDYKRLLTFLTLFKFPVFICLILLLNMNNNFILKFIFSLSLFIPTIHRLKEIKLKNFLFLSSRYHSTWICIILSKNIFKEWVWYFIAYRLIIVIALTVINEINILTFRDIIIIKNNHLFTLINLTFLNILGIPPTGGFIVKIIVIYQLYLIYFIDLIIVFMVTTSVFWVYNYFTISIKYWTINNISFFYNSELLNTNMKYLLIRLFILPFLIFS